MAGLHCADCIYASFEQETSGGRWQGTCSRGYTLCNAHPEPGTDPHFADTKEELVPTITPLGKEYFRTSNVCGEFRLPHKRA